MNLGRNIEETYRLNLISEIAQMVALTDDRNLVVSLFRNSVYLVTYDETSNCEEEMVVSVEDGERLEEMYRIAKSYYERSGKIDVCSYRRTKENIPGL